MRYADVKNRYCSYVISKCPCLPYSACMFIPSVDLRYINGLPTVGRTSGDVYWVSTWLPHEVRLNAALIYRRLHRVFQCVVASRITLHLREVMVFTPPGYQDTMQMSTLQFKAVNPSQAQRLHQTGSAQTDES